ENLAWSGGQAAAAAAAGAIAQAASDMVPAAVIAGLCLVTLAALAPGSALAPGAQQAEMTGDPELRRQADPGRRRERPGRAGSSTRPPRQRCRGPATLAKPPISGRIVTGVFPRCLTPCPRARSHGHVPIPSGGHPVQAGDLRSLRGSRQAAAAVEQ